MQINTSQNSLVKSDVEYIFANPGRAKIRVRVAEDELYVNTSGQVWTWRDGGVKFSLDWDVLLLPASLVEIAKAYIFHRLEARSLTTVEKDIAMLTEISKSAINYPWSESASIEILGALAAKDGSLASYFRVFYCWCVSSGKSGFLREIYFTLAEIKGARRNPYEAIFLHQKYVTPEQELLILRRIEETCDLDDFFTLRDNVLLHLSFELAPRPIQIALEDQAQSFIDASVDAMEIDRTRVPLQLEQTLEAVDLVIARCSKA